MNPHDEFLRQVRSNIHDLGNDDHLRALSREWIFETSKHGYSYNFVWLGRPIIQYPQDIVAIQEIVWRTRPDLIIETGIAHGGSLVLSASLLALLDYADAVVSNQQLTPGQSRRRVLGIDIDVRAHNKVAIDSHPFAHIIRTIDGSSTAPDVIARVHKEARQFSRVLVCLDSHHTADHVLAELRAYAPLVTVGSYCVVFDTIIEHMPNIAYKNRPWRAGNSPMTAVDRYMSDISHGHASDPNGCRLAFEIDQEMDNKLLTSAAPRGFLRRIPA